MKAKFPLVLGGVAILLVGLALGWWIAGRIPPPPLPPVPWTGPGAPPRPGEGRKDADGEHRERPKPTPEQIAKFREEMARIQPELEAFQKDFTALSQDYDTKFTALLTDDQKKIRERIRGPGPANGGPGSGGVDWISEFRGMAESRLGVPPSQADQGGGGQPGQNPGALRRRQQERLFRSLLHIVMYEPFLRLTVDAFHLTPEQAAATAQLMEARRVAFLKLADTHPLPFDQLLFSLRSLGLMPPPSGPGASPAPASAPAASPN